MSDDSSTPADDAHLRLFCCSMLPLLQRRPGPARLWLRERARRATRFRWGDMLFGHVRSQTSWLASLITGSTSASNFESRPSWLNIQLDKTLARPQQACCTFSHLPYLMEARQNGRHPVGRSALPCTQRQQSSPFTSRLSPNVQKRAALTTRTRSCTWASGKRCRRSSTRWVDWPCKATQFAHPPFL